MLYFITVWLFLLANCSIIGVVLFGSLTKKIAKNPVDYCFLGIWLGLSTILFLLMTASLLFPLSPRNGMVFVLALSALCLLLRRPKPNFSYFQDRYLSKYLFIFLCLLLLTAVFMNQTIEWVDSGIYHLGLINWIAQFGAVPGIALINFNFSKTSSWFALSAPFIFDFSQKHVGAMTNGFILLIASLQLVMTLERAKRFLNISSYFVVIFLLLNVINFLFLQPLFTRQNMAIMISFSPDVPVNLFIGVVAWSVLLILESAPVDASPIVVRKDPNLLDIKIVPLILASVATTIKVTALPLVVVTAVFYLVADARRPQRWLMTALIPGILLLPFFAHGLITSGCPLSPSQVMCLDLPWAVDADTSAAELSRVSGGTYAEAGVLSKWYGYVQQSLKLQIMAVLLAISAIWSIYFACRSLQVPKVRGILFVIALSWTGIIFLMMTSTLQILRFGLSYFLIIPCLFLATSAADQIPGFRLLKVLQLPKMHSLASFGVLGLIACLVVSHSYTFGHYGEFGWVLPPALPTPANYRIYVNRGIEIDGLLTQEVNDIVYTYPSAGNAQICWSDILVCTKPREDVYLRRPSEGLGAGFIRQP